MQVKTEAAFDINMTAEAVENFSKALEDFGQAALECAARLVDAFEPFVEVVADKYFEIQRYFLFIYLYRYLPSRLAWWIAWHWPRRFLPIFAFRKERLTEA